MYEGDEGGNKAKVRMCWETKKQKTELTGFQVRAGSESQSSKAQSHELAGRARLCAYRASMVSERVCAVVSV